MRNPCRKCDQKRQIRKKSFGFTKMGINCGGKTQHGTASITHLHKTCGRTGTRNLDIKTFSLKHSDIIDLKYAYDQTELSKNQWN